MRRRAGIEAWMIGQAVAVNSRTGHVVGIVADVGERGLTLTQSGARGSTVRSTRFMPWSSVFEVILASTLPVPNDIDLIAPTSDNTEEAHRGN